MINALSAFKDSLFLDNSVKLSLFFSTNIQELAFLDKASKPSAPVPANKSKQALLVRSWFSQLNSVSLTLPRVGLSP